MGSQSLCNAQKPSVLFLIFPQRQSLGHKCSTDLLGCQGNQSPAMEGGTWGERSVVFTHLAGIWDASGRKSICVWSSTLSLPSGLPGIGIVSGLGSQGQRPQVDLSMVVLLLSFIKLSPSAHGWRF